MKINGLAGLQALFGFDGDSDEPILRPGEVAMWNNVAHRAEIHAAGCQCLRKHNPRANKFYVLPAEHAEGELREVLERGDKVHRAPCLRRGVGAVVRAFKQRLLAARPAMAVAAQRVLDDWQQDDEGFDEEFGTGGACDAVAEGLISVILEEAGASDAVCGGAEGDDHEFVYAWDDETREAYLIDIPPGVYETGGGYSWRKRQGVVLDADDIVIEPARYEDVVESFGEGGGGFDGAPNDHLQVRMNDAWSHRAREFGLTAEPVGGTSALYEGPREGFEALLAEIEDERDRSSGARRGALKRHAELLRAHLEADEPIRYR